VGLKDSAEAFEDSVLARGEGFTSQRAGLSGLLMLLVLTSVFALIVAAGDPVSEGARTAVRWCGTLLGVFLTMTLLVFAVGQLRFKGTTLTSLDGPGPEIRLSVGLTALFSLASAFLCSIWFLQVAVQAEAHPAVWIALEGAILLSLSLTFLLDGIWKTKIMTHLGAHAERGRAEDVIVFGVAFSLALFGAWLSVVLDMHLGFKMTFLFASLVIGVLYLVRSALWLRNDRFTDPPCAFDDLDLEDANALEEASFDALLNGHGPLEPAAV
jgi:hypothetical protein